MLEDTDATLINPTSSLLEAKTKQADISFNLVLYLKDENKASLK